MGTEPDETETAEVDDIALLDTGLEREVERYIRAIKNKDMAAKGDAVAFCQEHNLIEGWGVSDRLKELVSLVFELAAVKQPKKRNRPPKGAPTRQAKGRPSDPKLHEERFEKVDDYITTEREKNSEVSVPAACRAVAGDQAAAYEKSYRKVESENYYASYYEPDYIEPTTK